MTGETGSVLVENTDATVSAAYPYDIKPTILQNVMPAPLDAAVASKLDANYSAGIKHLGAWL